MCSLLLIACLLGADVDYNRAYAASQKDKQPLAVLVGAEWCAPCLRIKQDPVILPALRQRAHVVVLDIDKDKQPAVLGVESVPTLLVWQHDRKLGWRVRRLFGFEDIKAYAVPKTGPANVPPPTR